MVFAAQLFVQSHSDQMASSPQNAARRPENLSALPLSRFICKSQTYFTGRPKLSPVGAKTKYYKMTRCTTR